MCNLSLKIKTIPLPSMFGISSCGIPLPLSYIKDQFNKKMFLQKTVQSRLRIMPNGNWIPKTSFFINIPPSKHSLCNESKVILCMSHGNMKPHDFYWPSQLLVLLLSSQKQHSLPESLEVELPWQVFSKAKIIYTIS